jgi:hypothetical protein
MDGLQLQKELEEFAEGHAQLEFAINKIKIGYNEQRLLARLDAEQAATEAAGEAGRLECRLAGGRVAPAPLAD